MDQEQARQFVIRELGRNHPKNEVIRELCERGGMDWGRATKFIEEVESEYGGQIAVRQSPLIVFLGIVILIGGIGLATTMVIMTLDGYIIFFLSLPIPYLGNAVYFLTGLGMIAGGFRGIWSTLIKLWNS
ncbi:MAG: hypothetical protein AB1649_03055 [Chloroflexota bacterium]